MNEKIIVCPHCQCESISESQLICHVCGKPYHKTPSSPEALAKFRANLSGSRKFKKHSNKAVSYKWIMLGIVPIIGFISYYYSTSAPLETQKPIHKTIEGDKYARINPSALSPYTIKNGYPRIVSNYGSRLSEIENFRKKAAEMAIDSGKCDSVVMSDLSENKSVLNHLHFWVDCENGQRIYLDEFQIKKNSPALTQEEKAWTRDRALTACQSAIKERSLIPSEVDIHSILGTSFYKAPVTQNVVLKMDFDAKNLLGISFSYTATCYFAPGEIGTIEITQRQ